MSLDENYINVLIMNLQQIISPSTQGIKSASKRLEKELYTNTKAIPSLIHVLQSHPDAQLRQLAGVEVSKQISKSWSTGLPADIKAQIRSSLLQSTFAEENSLVRHTSSRVISNIARLDLQDDEWPDLIKTLFEAANSESPAHREVAVYIIYTILDAFSLDVWRDNIELLHLLSRTIKDPQSKQTRISSVLAIGKMAEEIQSSSYEKNTPDERNPVAIFKAVLPEMVEVLKLTIADDDEKNASEIFDVFNNLVFCCDTALISQHFDQLVAFFANQIAADPNISEDYRNPAIQFFFNLIRYKKAKFKQSKLGPHLTECMLKIASEPFDEEEEDEKSAEDETLPGMKALRLLDFMSNILPPSQVMIPLLHLFPQLLGSEDRFQRHAAFAALSATVEGAPDTVTKHLGEILPLQVRGLQDPDALVQKGALLSLCQLAVELREDIGNEHETLLPLVFNIIDNAHNAKIAKTACTALDSILETLDSEIITEKYLPVLVPRLLHLFETISDLTVKGSIANALASAAFAAGKKFIPYFEKTFATFDPFIRASASSANEMTEEQAVLCSTVVDSVGSMAGAVGEEAFTAYVKPVSEAILACLESDKSRLKESGFMLVGILARMYGEEFAGVLPPVMDQLFKCLDQEEFGENFAEDEDDEETFEEVGLDNEEISEKFLENFNVNSAVAVEKEVAVETLSELIIGTKANFAPYLEKSVDKLIELSSHFYEGIRKAAHSALWRCFITVYKSSNLPEWHKEFPSTQNVPEIVASLAEKLRKTTIDTLGEEDDTEVVMTIFNLLSDAVNASGSYILGTSENLEQFCSEVLLVLKKEHYSQVLQDEYDDEVDGAKSENGSDDEEASESDNALTDSALDALISMAKAMGRNFNPIFNTSFPIIMKYCTNKQNDAERASGMGTLAELVSALGEESIEVISQVIGPLMQALDDKDLAVRSNGAFGIGMVCYYATSPEHLTYLKQHYLIIFGKLQKLLSKVDKNQRKASKKANKKELETDADLLAAANETNLRGIANACGCVARMCLAHADWVPMNEIVPVLLNLLPIYEGYEENEPILDLIMELYKQQSPIIDGLSEQVCNVLDEMFALQKEAEIVERNKSFGGFEDSETDYHNKRPFQTSRELQKGKELVKHLGNLHPGLVTSREVLVKALQE